MCLQEHPWRMRHCQRCRHRGGVAPCQYVKRAVAVGGVTLFRTRGDVCVCGASVPPCDASQQWRCHSASEQPPFNGASASPCLKVLVTSHILAWYHHASLWWHLVSTPPPRPWPQTCHIRPRPRPRNHHSASASASEQPLGLGLSLGLGTAARPRPRPRNRHSASASDPLRTVVRNLHPPYNSPKRFGLL